MCFILRWAASTHYKGPLEVTPPSNSESMSWINGFRRQGDERLQNRFIFQKTSLSKKKLISAQGYLFKARLSFCTHRTVCRAKMFLLCIFSMESTVTVRQDIWRRGLCMVYITFLKTLLCFRSCKIGAHKFYKLLEGIEKFLHIQHNLW